MSVNELYSFDHPSVATATLMELFMGIDIILKFFLQELDEELKSKK